MGAPLGASPSGEALTTLAGPPPAPKESIREVRVAERGAKLSANLIELGFAVKGDSKRGVRFMVVNRVGFSPARASLIGNQIQHVCQGNIFHSIVTLASVSYPNVLFRRFCRSSWRITSANGAFARVQGDQMVMLAPGNAPKPERGSARTNPLQSKYVSFHLFDSFLFQKAGCL